MALSPIYRSFAHLRKRNSISAQKLSYRFLTFLPGGNEDTEAESRVRSQKVSKLNVRYRLFANGGVQTRAGMLSIVEIVQSLALPIVFYLIIVNAVFIGISIGSSVTMSPVLLAPPYNWPFESVEYIVAAAFVASIFVQIISGSASDSVTNRLTKRNDGKREAEMNLWKLIFPLFCGCLGCIIYGVGGQYVYSVH